MLDEDDGEPGRSGFTTIKVVAGQEPWIFLDWSVYYIIYRACSLGDYPAGACTYATALGTLRTESIEVRFLIRAHAQGVKGRVAPSNLEP